MSRFYSEINERFKGIDFLNDIKNFIENENDEEIREYLSFLYLNMPYADVANVDKEVLLDYATHAKKLRETRCKKMEEDIFLNYVLFHRVNNEKIVANRSFFYEKVKDLLGDDEKENIIKLNYFCAGEVTYRSTDERTLDPMSIYKSSFGRCGEESTFVTSVFRAAGIAARQVYSPNWAHCDDNHAWVEVYLDGKWHYLGACEPEEILDKGWFDDASARSMLVRSRLFAYKVEDSTDLISKNDILCELNQTSRYADVKKISFMLRQGKEVLKNFNFDICVMNYAGFLPVANVKTDDFGKYEIELALGTVFLSLYKDKNYIIPINTEEKENFDIDINEYVMEYFKYKEVYINVPKASTRNRKKAPERKKYEYKLKDFPNIVVKDKSIDMGMKDLWENLSEKDKRDISIEVLEEAYNTPNLYEVQKEIYINYIQNPRVEFEVLSPCRRIFREKFKTISDILAFVKEMKLTREIFTTEAKGVYKIKLASALSLRIFIVTAIRSLGIAAKLENNQIYIYKDGTFVYLEEADKIIDGLAYIDGFNIEKETDVQKSYLLLDDVVKDYMQTFSVAKYNPYTKSLIYLDANSIKEKMLVESGEYVVSTSNRLPNGNICAKFEIIKLQANEEYKLNLEYMQADIGDMLSQLTLPDGILEKVEFDSEYTLLMWLKEEEEPSQHIANDLLQKEALLKNLDMKLLFTKDFEKKDFAINKLLENSKKNKIFTDFGEVLQESFGRSVFVNHETLPIVALCKNKKAIYAFSGYQVGSGDMIEKIINKGV